MAVLLGEIVGRYTNDFIMNVSIRRNKGVFQAESRLWACYIGVPLHICGFVTLGAALEKHMGVGVVIIGWGIAQFSVMINTVAVYAYCNDAFPKHAVRHYFSVFLDSVGIFSYVQTFLVVLS